MQILKRMLIKQLQQIFPTLFFDIYVGTSTGSLIVPLAAIDEAEPQALVETEGKVGRGAAVDGVDGRCVPGIGAGRHARLHGGADRITNVNHSRRLYDAYRGPREIWIVQGAPHAGAYFADRPLYVERVAGFFARHLGLNVSGHLRLVEEEEVS